MNINVDAVYAVVGLVTATWAAVMTFVLWRTRRDEQAFRRELERLRR